MASYKRMLKRAMARGKKSEDITYKCNPHGGHPMPYECKDNTQTMFAGEAFPGLVKGFNPFTEKGGLL